MSAPAVPIGADAPVLEVMATMRAMRRLRPDPVPDELLERLVDAATWASGRFGPVRRRSAAEVVHRDRW